MSATTAAGRRAASEARVDPYRDYLLMVKQRRHLGARRYGDRHLRRDDLALNRVGEAADTVVYLTLHRRALRADPTPPIPHTIERLGRLTREAARLGQLCAALVTPGWPGPMFAGVLAARFAYGERHHGDAYLERDNLAEALEEIADIHILCALERERHARSSGAVHPRPAALTVITDRCVTLAEGVLTLRAHHAAPRSVATVAREGPGALTRTAAAYLRVARAREPVPVTPLHPRPAPRRRDAA